MTIRPALQEMLNEVFQAKKIVSDGNLASTWRNEEHWKWYTFS